MSYWLFGYGAVYVASVIFMVVHAVKDNLVGVVVGVVVGGIITLITYSMFRDETARLEKEKSLKELTKLVESSKVLNDSNQGE